MNISNLPGAGAAGGIGGAMHAFLRGKLMRGIDVILDAVDFENKIDDRDLILTGEGKMDAQTGMGKALGGILDVAKSKNIPVIGIAGTVENSAMLNETGFTALFSIVNGPVTLEKAMNKEYASESVRNIVTQVIRLIETFNSKK